MASRLRSPEAPPPDHQRDDGDDAYFALKLNSWRPDAWAVVRRSTGAIVERDSKLLMRLSQSEASDLAAQLSRSD